MVILDGFGDSGINLRLAVWAKSEEFLKFRSSLAELIKKLLYDNKIEIPFPHMSLYAGENSEPIKITVTENSVEQKNHQ